jgi:hypothetical protein
MIWLVRVSNGQGFLKDYFLNQELEVFEEHRSFKGTYST